MKKVRIKLPKKITLTNVVIMTKYEKHGGKTYLTKDAFMYRVRESYYELAYDFVALTGKDKGKAFLGIWVEPFGKRNGNLKIGDYLTKGLSTNFCGDFLNHKIEQYEDYEFVDTNFLSEYNCVRDRNLENVIWEEIEEQITNEYGEEYLN